MQAEITLNDINKNVENLGKECEKLHCHPVYKVCIGIHKLVCDLLKCF